MGTAYHPQSSGQVERYNQVLSQLLRCTIHQVGDGAHWKDLLPTVQFAANTNPSRSTGYTPFFLNFGRHPTTPVQLLDQNPIRSKTEAVSTFVQRLRDHFVKAQANMKHAADRMKSISDRRRREVIFATGDSVLLSTKHLKPAGSAKLQRRFVGPFPILERIGSTAYRLDLPASWKIHPVFHVSLLKDYRSSRLHPVQQRLPVLVPAEDAEPEFFDVERILRWRWSPGQRRKKEYLVLWSGHPIDEATWEPTSHFASPGILHGLLKRDKPSEAH